MAVLPERECLQIHPTGYLTLCAAQLAASAIRQCGQRVLSAITGRSLLHFNLPNSRQPAPAYR